MDHCGDRVGDDDERGEAGEVSRHLREQEREEEEERDVDPDRARRPPDRRADRRTHQPEEADRDARADDGAEHTRVGEAPRGHGAGAEDGVAEREAREGEHLADGERERHRRRGASPGGT